jgi:hypothetical protein
MVLIPSKSRLLYYNFGGGIKQIKNLERTKKKQPLSIITVAFK